MKRTESILLLAAAMLGAAACGTETEAEFGPANEVAAGRRNLVWDAPATSRLGLRPSVTAKIGETPAGWEELPANPARFRNAVWRVAGQPNTDCYLTIGVGGGAAFNMKRWYQQQFGMEVPTLESLLEIPFAGQTGRLCELEGSLNGKADQAALIAFLTEGQSVTSLKFTGPKDVLAQQREAFLALAKSINVDGTPGAGAGASGPRKAPPIQPGQKMPEGHVPTGGAPHAAGPAEFTASAPAGWTAVTGSSRQLHYKFGRDSEVYVSKLGGTLQQSLGIWRGSFQQGGQRLGPLSDEDYAALPKMKFLGDDAVLMEISGQYQGLKGAAIEDALLLLAARQEGNAITFCKLVGTREEVESQRDAFQQFCGSIQKAQ
ncbi:MAG: hypothetical protein AB8H80_21320 [Planctomycetota bacterium]